MLETKGSLRIVVCGDFNDLRKSSDQLRSLAYLKPYVDFPTRGSNTLDQIYSNFDTYKRTKRLPPYGRCDYATIFWEPCAPQTPTVIKREVRKYTTSDKLAFHKFVISVDWLSLCSSTRSLNDCASTFLQMLKTCVDFSSLCGRSGFVPRSLCG